jgi:hypothetical protein
MEVSKHSKMEGGKTKLSSKAVIDESKPIKA